MWHALGESVHPIRLGHVAATIFTDPEIATVGVSQRAVDAGEVAARTQNLPLATNPRAKMAGFREGFVKLFTSPGTGVILGGVIVAPRASELILAVSVAMEQRLTAEQLAQTFTVYPSLSGSVTVTDWWSRLMVLARERPSTVMPRRRNTSSIRLAASSSSCGSTRSRDDTSVTREPSAR